MTPATPVLSVIISAHNPDPGRLYRTLAGLRAQSLETALWECLLVDNASTAFPPIGDRSSETPANLRVIKEPVLGLTSARICGLRASRGDFAVLVDDDNVLAPDYLARVLEIFSSHPHLGAIGGRILPEFESPPPDWAREFLPLLALRDLGDGPILSSGLRVEGTPPNRYPAFAPVGAGMALRRAAWEAWLGARSGNPRVLGDRQGAALTSAGDNDIVFCAMHAGWEVGYFPQLGLTHLIPAGRLEAAYLARLNRGIQQSWMQVLMLHDACPWPPLSPWGAAARKLKAWFGYRAWTSHAARIRWQGACGHFDGRAGEAVR